MFLHAPSGRQRFNVLGALQAVTHRLLTVTDDTYITAESVYLLLEQVASAGGALPIAVVLDNASYQLLRPRGRLRRAPGGSSCSSCRPTTRT